MKNTKSVGIIAIVGTIIALCLCIYLVQHHYDLQYGQQSSKSFCSVNSHFDCDSVNISSFSEILGIPVALFGAFTFGVELLFLIGGMILAEDEKPRARRMYFYFSLLNIAFCIYLAIVSSFILKTYCLYCLTIYALSALIFICAYQLVKPLNGVFRNIVSDLKSWASLLLVAAIPVGSYVVDASMKDSISKDLSGVLDQTINDWTQNKKFDFFITGAPRIGKPDAKLTLVVFSDFECPHCKKAAPSLHAFVNAHRNDVQLIYQNYPLDSSCNPKGGMHQHACLFARVAICAHQQGKFQQTHDWIYDHQESLSDSLVDDLISQVGLDKSKMDACLKDPETSKTLGEQINRGNLADIQGTPSVFANGQLLQNGYLIPLLERALAHLK